MQQARRTSLQRYEIDSRVGTLQSQIEMPNRLWTAHGAPLAAAVARVGIGDTPILTVEGKSYPVQRDWLSEKGIISYYCIYLQDDDGHRIIEANTPHEKRASLIHYQGADFLVAPRSFFAFHYEVTNQGKGLARFKDVSPFWTFSARRRYAIETNTAGNRAVAAGVRLFYGRLPRLLKRPLQ